MLRDAARRLIVERTRRLIQDEDSRRRDERPCQGDTLPLPAGERRPAVTDPRIIALRQLQNKIMRIGQLRCTDNFLHAGFWMYEGNIIAHAAVKEKILLRDHTNLAAQAEERDFLYRVSIVKNLPLIRQV